MASSEPRTSPVQNYIGHENLAAMAAMGQYNRWIYDTVASYIGHRLLEAGCGNGNLTTFFIQSPGMERYVGVDLSPAFCETLRRTVKPPTGCSAEFHVMDLQDPRLSELARPSFDTIVCSNVLEHIQDDQGTLQRFYSMLEPGGKIILQVPAFQLLYGTIDAVDQHVRRYSRPDLIKKVQVAGFSILKASYFNLFGILAWIWHGKILKHQAHPKEDLQSWDRWVPMLRRVESIFPLPMGLSLFVVGEKPK